MKTKLMWILVGLAALGLHAGMVAATGKPPQVPEECLEPHLPKEVQRLCDQLRFADVPHYHVVRLADQGAVRSIHLLETETGRAVVTSYPHGIHFAAPDQNDRELRIRPEELEGALKGRPRPAAPAGFATAQQPPPAPVAQAPTGFATGLPIGWKSSTGPASGQCFNYTIATPSNNLTQASFSSQSTASSTAAQIKVSAEVNLAFDLFNASDSFSFSDQWQSSTHSSNQYYNMFSLYTLNSTVSQTDPLTSQGEAHVTDGTFDVLCGNEYLAVVPVGLFATFSVNYGSSSESTALEITNKLTLDFGLDSVSVAVDFAQQDTSSTSYFTFNLVHYGGGPAVSQAFLAPFTAKNAADQAFYALCAQGDADACTTFTTSLGDAAGTALTTFDEQVAGLTNAANPDLSFFQTFPNGVAGVVTPQAVMTPIPPIDISTSDVLAPYQQQLETYLTLLNQITTLKNRVDYLQGLLHTTPVLNPALFLDIGSYLSRLHNIYNADRTTLRTNLGNCLSASSANVESVCQPIIHNQAANAFEYYAPSGAGQDFFAQQNTLALQYTGLESVPGSTFQQFPQDVIYIDELPSFTAAGSPVPIAGEAAFVSFLDRPIPPAPGVPVIPIVDLLALTPDVPLSTNNVSTKVRVNPASPSPFTAWTITSSGIFTQGETASAAFTTTPCTPTFAQPCSINYSSLLGGGSSFNILVEHSQIQDMFAAE